MFLAGAGNLRHKHMLLVGSPLAPLLVPPRDVVRRGIDDVDMGFDGVRCTHFDIERQFVELDLGVALDKGFYTCDINYSIHLRAVVDVAVALNETERGLINRNNIELEDINVMHVVNRRWECFLLCMRRRTTCQDAYLLTAAPHYSCHVLLGMRTAVVVLVRSSHHPLVHRRERKCSREHETISRAGWAMPQSHPA